MHRETLLIEKIEEGETFSFYYCDNSNEMHWCIKKDIEAEEGLVG